MCWVCAAVQWQAQCGGRLGHVEEGLGILVYRMSPVGLSGLLAGEWPESKRVLGNSDGLPAAAMGSTRHARVAAVVFNY